MEILAHRGIGFGEEENTLKAFRAARELDFGLELDARLLQNGAVHVTHDLQDVNLTLDSVKTLLSGFKSPIAVHVKEDSLELAREVCRSTAHCPRVFIFDLTLEAAREIKNEFPQAEIGLSVGEQPFLPTVYSLDEVLNVPECGVVWWDEWTKLGAVYNEGQIRRIREAGKVIYAVSPELHKSTVPHHELAGSPEIAWRELVRLGVNGICTDFPLELRAFLAEEKRR